jgi:hypothetical protein
VISTVRPDFEKVHELVRKALQAPASKPAVVQPTPGTPKAGPAKADTTAADVNAVC